MPLPKGPNYGSDAQVVSKVRAAVKILQELAGTIDPASDIGKAVFDSIKKLSAHAPANKATQGLENTALQDIAAKAKQSAPLMGLMGGAAGIPQGGSGSPLGAAAPKPV
jgi:hypothetical protein